MKWDYQGFDKAILVAEDGEILERITKSLGGSEWFVHSTNKTYLGIEAAKKAAEKNQGKRNADQ